MRYRRSIIPGDLGRHKPAHAVHQHLLAICAWPGLSGAAGMLEGMATPVASPVLVGRTDQLEALNAALADAGRGRPSTVLIGGEAGIGKSPPGSEFPQ